MIHVSRLNGEKYTINPFLIESYEQTLDTTVVLFNSGRRVVVKEKIEDIENQFSQFLGKAIRNSAL
jgi:uncharacterized protein YlzI (FlbEa/FlbD family)